MPLLADRVLEATATTGTGTFSLAGALTGYVTFNSAFSNGDVVFYTADNGLGEWEVGYGTVGTGTLSRDAVLESSNAGALVDFSAGTKRLFCTAPATQLPPNQTGNTGKVLTTDGVNLSWETPTTGTVTAVSVATANGLAGSSSGGATPELTLSTTITGVLVGDGAAISAGSAGTDYAPPTSGTDILKGNGSGGFSAAVANTDYLPVTNPEVTGVMKVNGATSGYVGLQGAADAGSTTYVLPAADGAAGEALVTDGSANLSWGTAGITTGKAIAMAMIFGG